MDLKYTTLLVVLIIFVSFILLRNYGVGSGEAFKIIKLEDSMFTSSEPQQILSYASDSTLTPAKKTSRILSGRTIAAVEEDRIKYYHQDKVSSNNLVTDEYGNKKSAFKNTPFGTEMGESNENYKFITAEGFLVHSGFDQDYTDQKQGAITDKLKELQARQLININSFF